MQINKTQFELCTPANSCFVEVACNAASIVYIFCIYSYGYMFIVLSLPPFSCFCTIFFDTVRAWSPFSLTHLPCSFWVSYSFFVPVSNGSPPPNNNIPLKSTINKHVPHFLLHTESDSFLSQCFVHLSFIVDYLFLLHCGSFNLGCIAFFYIFFIVVVYCNWYCYCYCYSAIFDAYSTFISIEFNGWLDSFLVACVAARDNWQRVCTMPK